MSSTVPERSLVAGWGELEAFPSTLLAPCGGRAPMTLHPVQVASVGATRVLVGSVEDRTPRRGRARRLDVSFRIPAEHASVWNHAAAFAAFDDSDDVFRRVGGAVFESMLTVEVVDPACPVEQLLAAVPIPGGIAPERWYRLLTDVESGADQTLVRVALFAHESRAQLAATQVALPCPLPWAAYAKTAAAFLAEVPADSDASPWMLVDGYAAHPSLRVRSAAARSRLR
ncbi:MAG TPA: hypothetical protein VIS07_07710 [Candidatus Binatia bacterium]